MRNLLSTATRLRAAYAGLVLLAAVCVTPFAHAVQPAEFSQCSTWQDVPYSILFKKESVGWPGDIIRRIETYYDGSVRYLFKNPEGVSQNGPSHGRNCTVNQTPNGTQWIRFRLKTQNYFGTQANGFAGVGWHIPILLRSFMKRDIGELGGSQTGHGMALFRPGYDLKTVEDAVRIENWNAPGTFTTSFPNPNSQNPSSDRLVLEDGKWFSFEIHVNPNWIGLTVIKEEAPTARLQWSQQAVPRTDGQPAPAVDTGYGFGVVCAYDDSCETVPNFEVLIQDIQTNWF